MKTQRTAAEIAADKFRTGRPPVTKAQYKGRILSVRVTPAEGRALEAAAKRDGCTLSDVLLRPWREPKKRG